MNDHDLCVVVVRHNESVDLLKGCLETISEQSGINLKVLVIDQRNEREIEGLVLGFEGSGGHRFSYHSVETDSISHCRNLGIALSGGRCVAFTDPDCRLEPGWAAELYKALQDPEISVAGGQVILTWQGKKRWLHDTLFVRERFAYLNLGPQPLRTNRIMGSSFAIDCDGISPRDFFSETLGRDGGRLYGGEETDLCERLISRGAGVFYVPGAVVHHLIPPDRMAMKALVQRFFFAGYSRSKRGGAPKPLHSLRSTRDYLAIAIFLPFYAAGYAYARLDRGHKPGNP